MFIKLLVTSTLYASAFVPYSSINVYIFCIYFKFLAVYKGFWPYKKPMDVQLPMYAHYVAVYKGLIICYRMSEISNGYHRFSYRIYFIFLSRNITATHFIIIFIMISTVIYAITHNKNVKLQ